MPRMPWIPRVLVAEDSDDLRMLVTANLEMFGAKVFHTSNGRDALDLARREHPDVVILDLQMPVLTGEEFIATAIQDPDLKDIPIIVLTAFGDTERIKGLKSLVSCIITKPFGAEELIEKVRKVAKRNGHPRP
jgi:DNA-binding response OmpR family regulator